MGGLAAGVVRSADIGGDTLDLSGAGGDGDDVFRAGIT